ncbi:MAG: acyltransferase [Burkholderiales bacterium]|nr:acyltransferase [Burkholderiales bacterium]
MLNFLPAPLRGILSTLLLILNTLACGAIIISLSVFKFVLPFKAVRRVLDTILNAVAERWIGNNSLWMGLAQRIRWRVEGIDNLRYKGWYLVESNHQGWVDIFVLQKIFNRRIPFLKFFLKRQLIFVPVIGLAWWALDFPFMKRRSEAWLKKHPERRGEDLETTRRACEKFSLIPTSVMNFLEGTRFTRQKHDAQRSPFTHLLRPKTGGIALALNAMGEKFQSLVDVTIFYPEGTPSLWDLLTGRVKQVVVQVRELPIPREFTVGDYAGDPDFRAQIQNWIHELWQEKDRRLSELRREYAAMAAGATSA